jgi:O-6-methylguanine DNA methyltransferase
MTCQQVQTTLADLSLPRLQAGKYTALHQHIRRCSACQPLWQQWLRHEQQLVGLAAVQAAPDDLFEHIMAAVAAHPTESEKTLRSALDIDVSSHGLRRLQLSPPEQFDSMRGHMAPVSDSSSLVDQAHRQLAEYFDGHRVIFQLPVDLRHCSDFETAVLQATREIPYGEVRPYKWIAERIGRPKAMRAIGNALHKNPVPIVIPCHRVVKSDGSMGGYAFGERWKQRLLQLERDTVPFIGCPSTRILCYRGCQHERRIGANNRIHFAALADALENGYRPCRVCQPDTSLNRNP